MWLCASRGRPGRLAEMADSWEATIAKPCKLVIRPDEDDPLLKGYTRRENGYWPAEWEFHVGSPLQGAAQSHGWAFSRFPNESFYGALGDDVILRSPGWNKTLEAEAGSWHLAFPDDGIQHGKLATHPCIGGDLLRALGFWTLPELRHSYVDTMLHVVAAHLKLLKYCPHVFFEHMHPLAGKAPDDETYRRSAKHWDHDSAVFYKWLHNQAKHDIERVRRIMRKENAK